MELPLTRLKDGEAGIITSIKVTPGRGRGGGWGFQKRLMDMGLTPGTKVTVIKSAPFHGPIEIDVRGSRLALGRGMAEKIFVEIAK
ncbi:MAG: FeoA family protein [Candidatus Bathyarchaeia archaeon]